jgi:hypothetical protein
MAIKFEAGSHVKIAPIVHIVQGKRHTQTVHYVPAWPKYRNGGPDSKYTGSMLRVIRAAHGVGRPPEWKMAWATPNVLL